MVLLSLLALAAQSPVGDFDPGPNPYLMRDPTMNSSTVVFSFAGDLWTVPRTGGEARRLTSQPGSEGTPHFSPDGSKIAFTGSYNGDSGVYVMSANGGNPKRLTYHPGGADVAGWTPDGKNILMTSMLKASTPDTRMFTVSVDGGPPKMLPFPQGQMPVMSPDMTQIAYVPHGKWQHEWKRYRGGQAYPIWIGNMSDSKVYEIPRRGWNDHTPMWVGDKIYFISDPTGFYALHSYDVKTKKVSVEVPGKGFDIKSASAGPGGIVYEKLGSLNIYDLATKKSNRINITIQGDFKEAMPQWKNIANNLSFIAPSPSGQRALITARGMIATVPAQKGDARVLDPKQGVHRRGAVWSPDGRTIAYLSNENQKQQMCLLDVATNKKKFMDLGASPAYYESAGAHAFSPDSKRIAYYDFRNKLWLLNVETGENVEVDEGVYADPLVIQKVSWSPDSKWITWARDLDSHMFAVFLYNVDTKKKVQLTDGMSFANHPIFDRDGKHLYFSASLNAGLSTSWLDMSAMTNPMRVSNVYAVVLRKDLPSPLRPESDEETPKPASAPAPAGPAAAGPPAAAPAEASAPAKPKDSIDLDGIERRIIRLPLPPADYTSLEPANPGAFFAFTGQPRVNPLQGGFISTVTKFSVAERRGTPWGTAFAITTTPDGMKAIVSGPGGSQMTSTMAPPQPGMGALSIDSVRVKLDPKVEWRSMFNEIWDNHPLKFYAENLHGIDPEVMRKRYEPFLENVMTRNDLNYLFWDMICELSTGHMWASGGDQTFEGTNSTGLLGIDFEMVGNKCKITRVFDGEVWNGLLAPMATPGVNAQAGEFLLEIDGQEVKADSDVYQLLEGKAGRQVKVKIAADASGKDAREVVVVPVGSEMGLRARAWVEDNRRYVAKMTGGRGAYVYVPDTGDTGFMSFMRYYYAQTDRDGVIVDERFNSGGYIADFIIYEMSKTMDGAFSPRFGKDWPTPGTTIYGPKVMLVNQAAGSGGDMLPWLFRHKNLGPIVGTRTWGGLVASWGFPLADGGNINSPNCAFYNPKSGKWEVEGFGVQPDVEVPLDPFMWRQGKDSQLEAAIAELNKRLATYKRPVLKRPANPDKSKIPHKLP